MVSEELERAYLYKLDDYLANMTDFEKDLFFRLSLAQAEEMTKHSKNRRKISHETENNSPDSE